MGTNGLGRVGWDLAAVSAVVSRYYVSIAPVVRDELSFWRERARRIPDPSLRAAALDNLDGEYLHVHAAAVFGTLAPRRQRRRLVRLLVAFEVMYDYLDTLSEQPSSEWIANGLQLHTALAATISSEVGTDFYALHERSDDGGYLAELVAACRARYERLPASASVLPAVTEAMARCAEGQTRAHAAVGDVEQLERWGRQLLDADSEYRWWELTAATASSLVVHALFAAAAAPATTRDDAEAVAAAYYPALSALTTLLDSLVDYEDDRRSGEHSYVGYYASSAVAALRLAALAATGLGAVAALPHARRHAVIATGIAGFYLAAPTARGEFAALPKRRVVAALRAGLIYPVLLAVAVKRRF